MSYFNDALTIGLVLILLFGSIALFLYTRMTQSEQKISVLESIILDIKMASEIKSYKELPMDEVDAAPTTSSSVSLPTASSSVTIPMTYPSFDDIESTASASASASAPVTMTEEVPVYRPFVDEQEEAVHPNVEEQKEHEQEQEHVLQAVDLTEYDTMSLKELQAIARSRGLPTSGAKKNALIEALKSSDHQQTVESLSMNA